MPLWSTCSFTYKRTNTSHRQQHPYVATPEVLLNQRQLYRVDVATLSSRTSLTSTSSFHSKTSRASFQNNINDLLFYPLKLHLSQRRKRFLINLLHKVCINVICQLQIFWNCDCDNSNIIRVRTLRLQQPRCTPPTSTTVATTLPRQGCGCKDVYQLPLLLQGG